MAPTPVDRRRAEALQRALERYDALLAAGGRPAEAREEVARTLRGARRAFELAVGLTEAGASVAQPDPAFVRSVAARLRSAEVMPLAPRRSRRTPGFAPLAAAACIAIFAALLVPSLRSLPGDRLYGLKGFSEDTRLLFAAGATEARVRLDLADERFSEVERLIERASLARAFSGSSGAAVAAPAFTGGPIDDPELSRLIEATLDEAGHHLEEAADILTRAPASAEDLDELVTISRRGHRLATEVADDLPNSEQPPVLSTVVKLAKIEAAAKAARTKARPKVTPDPCATPTPKPTPATTPAPTAPAPSSTPNQRPTTEPGAGELTPPPTEPPPDHASGTAVQSSAPPSATPTPSATPCTSPSPTPTPTPAPTAANGDEPEAGGDVDTSEGVDGAEDGDETGMQANAPGSSGGSASA